ncbi:MAG: Chromosome segregation ATPases [uncultured Frankineae bacterium]|uniref:Chromosome segregation ATPases n=1 Tax=uncultured Frankineae bacterium TaxID=437475 RepID=A0A6J4KEQ4_9ACTN|nr:MAG: Chromosome segregation ATPases [uncultured Frankineae bacterium]
MPATTDLRLRVPSPGLLALPWDRPLELWDTDSADLRELPVGPSRHLVRFVQADDQLWAIKELPERVAAREYAVLRELESRSLPAVKAAGLALQHDTSNALLVTRYLDGSWQFRRLLMRLPPNRPLQRARLLDAMASLLVDLHRNGVYWGDCSLANTLFSRDGQRLQAWLVDAETSEIHPQLTDGQRRYDLEIMVENVAGGLLDLAVMLDRPPEIYPQLMEEAAGVAPRYAALWEILHEQPLFSFADRRDIEGRIRKLNDLGFAVDEVELEPTGAGNERLRLKVTVAARRYHATELFSLTGLEVGEGQAQVLLSDLRAYEATLLEFTGGLYKRTSGGLTQAKAVQLWMDKLLKPGMERAYEAVGRIGDPVQAYCDLLEVRWLLSEQAGYDVGDGAALDALAERRQPPDSAAMVVIAEEDTAVMRRPTL